MSYAILVADDSAIVRTMVKKALAMAGLDVGQVHEAGDGQEALEVLGRTWIDVVFADINMPRMNGIELIEEVKRVHGTLPILVLTTEGAPELIQRARSAGAKAWLIKPFKPAQLASVVEKLAS